MVARALILFTTLQCMVACTKTPVAAAVDGGATPCFAGFVPKARSVVIKAGQPQEIDVEVYWETIPDFCANLNDMKLVPVTGNGPLGDVIIRTEEQRVTLLAPESGLYRVTDMLNGRRSRYIVYVGKPQSQPDLVIPARCEDIQRISDSSWACNGQLFDDEGKAVDGGTANRWMPLDEAHVVVDRADGLWLLDSNNIQQEAGQWLVDAGNVLAWSRTDDGFIVANEQGFTECQNSEAGLPDNCRFLGKPQIPPQLTPETESLIVDRVFRLGETRMFTFESSYWLSCEIGATECDEFGGGKLWVTLPNNIWGISPFYDDRHQEWVYQYEWRDRWVGAGPLFVGPEEFQLKGGGRGVSPERLIFSDGNIYLVVNIDDPESARYQLEYYRFEDAISYSNNAGASVSFFWVSRNREEPRTEVYFRKD